MSRSASRSSSASHAFRRLTMMLSCSFFSDTASSSSLSWASVTFWRSWPVCARTMSLFSTSVARSSLTSRILPSRSAASGCRI